MRTADYIEISNIIADGIQEYGEQARLWLREGQYYCTPYNIDDTPTGAKRMSYEWDGAVYVARDWV